MPLYDSTMAFATDRPIPQPPFFWVRAVSVRKKRSKSCSGLQHGSDSQVFSKQIAADFPSFFSVITILLSGMEYFTALVH